MAVDLRNLKVGSIYEINNITSMGTYPPGSFESMNINPLVYQRVKYIKIIDKTPYNADFMYTIMPLRNDLSDWPLVGPSFVYPHNIVPYGRKIMSYYPIPISRELHSPTSLVTDSKSKVQAVKDVLAKKGVPDESDTGPLSNILGMAGIKAPPKQSGVGRRKTRKGKKSKRKTHKRK
jgi:hypothetical protein